MQSSSNVCIKGIGVISSVGKDVPQTWSSLLNSFSGCNSIKRFSPSYFPVQIAAEVPPKFYGNIKNSSLAFTFAIQAISEALVCAGLEKSVLGPETALVVGVGGDDDGDDVILRELNQLASNDPQKTFSELGTTASKNPFDFKDSISLESLAAEIANHYGIEGETLCVSTACSSGAHAIALAADLIKSGDAKRVIAVGTDSMVSRLNLALFCPLGVLSQRNRNPAAACRPFDSRRQGFVLSEGAGALVLEDFSLRGFNNTLSFLAGYGVSADAFSITDKDTNGEGVFQAIKQAISCSNMEVEQISYINAHGTGTRRNDETELRAIEQALGAHAKNVSISSIKGQIGHTIAAAGAIEAIITILSINKELAPGTSTLEQVSENMKCFNLLKAGWHKIKRGAGMTISAGFGGTNVCLIFEPLYKELS